MSRLQVRALPIVGTSCLLGAGWLLLRSAGDATDSHLVHPVLFLVLTVILAVTLGLATRGRRAVVRAISLSAVTLLFVAAVGALVASVDGVMRGSGRAPAEARLEEARTALEDLEPALQRTAARILAEIAVEPIEADTGGEPFRRIARWPAIWREEFDCADLIPLEAVIWSGERRLAWTPRAVPLAVEFAPAPDPGIVSPLGALRLARGRGGGALQAMPMRNGEIGIELQLRFRTRALEPRWPAVVQEIAPKRILPLRTGPEGEEIPEAVLVDERSQLAYRVALAAGAIDAGPGGAPLRWLLAAALLWLPAAAIGGYCFAGRGGLLAGLWAGRVLLAVTGFFRLLGPAWPGLQFPARPAGAASLIDPAYFATPLWSGFFASTADALLTAALGALTVWVLLRRGGGLDSADGRTEPEPGAAPAPAAALVLGIVLGGALPALRRFAGLIAENSNARLIGDGVSLSSLSFWVLHVVLMLAGLALLSLAALPVRRAGLPRRATFGRWALGSVIAALGAVLASAPIGALDTPARLLLGVFAAAVYWIVPVLRARPRFLRRLAWPCLLLAVVCWNYLSLRDVYSLAERAWLERKGELITDSAEDWMLFLLDDTLDGMREAEGRLDRPSGESPGLWRNEAAYRLWQESALQDLGYACLIELIDAEGLEESLFATGQMRDFEFRVAGRSPWTDAAGDPVGEDWLTAFQTEERIFADGREAVLAGEIRRRGGRGSIRVEIPVKSDRIGTLEDDLAGRARPAPGQYRPRAEVDRPVLLLRGDAEGWSAAGVHGFPLPGEEEAVAALRSGELPWAEIRTRRGRWLCRWEHLPSDWADGPEDGFLLGLEIPGFRAVMLDLSRLMLLDLALFYALVLLIRGPRSAIRLLPGRTSADAAPQERWRPGFQERFLAGYLLLGLVLLVVVGTSVDRVGQDRIGREAREQTRAGLSLAVQQMRGLLVEQARSLAGSEYIADLLLGQLSGQRPAGPADLRQGMVFAGDGTLLLDETLSDLSPAEAALLLEAGRRAPFLLLGEEDELYVATVIPIDLEDVWIAARSGDAVPPEDSGRTDGFFLYRQRFEEGLLVGLADLARGEATLRVAGRPVFASHPSGIFSGAEPLLLDPSMMESLRDHPAGPAVFAAGDRSFAYTGCQPLPAFGPDRSGRLTIGPQPAVLALAFPDREREFVAQRRATVLFLAGLANLILLTALLLAVLLSWNIFRPLRVLLAATKSLARGDFEAPLPEAGSDEVGRLAEAFGLMRSQLHSARDRLAAREQFLATVLDRVTVGVAVLDAAGQPVTLNPAGRRILEEFDPGDEEGRAQRLLERFRSEAGADAHSAGELRSADGRRTLRAALAPLDFPNGRTDTMLVFEDITEFLQTKMMAINAELARQVAHEIKNPLTPIQLTIQLLDQAWRDEHPQLDRIVKDTVRRVLEQVDLLRTIASEFSLLGRPGELEIEPLDLGALVARTVEAYGAASSADGARENAPRISLPDGTGPVVLGHEDSLQKILGNLMQNSLDAALAGEPARIEVDWSAGDDQAVLVWRDHGQGIADDVAERLFDPYFSTKSSGTGLGLAICRNLADRMGGGITLGAPADGAGAVAELTLPLATEGNAEQ